MKLLFENWRQYIKELETRTIPRPGRKQSKFQQQLATKQVTLSSPNQQHNYAAISKLVNESDTVKEIFMKGWKPEMKFGAYEMPPDKEIDYFIKFMIANNKVFEDNKLIKFLGAGTFGFVFLLENDHALKVYMGSYIPEFGTIDPSASSDTARYKKEQDKAFTGSGTKTDLMIYDEGTIKTPFGRDWFYAEMPRLTPLSSHMAFIHGKSGTEWRSSVADEVSFLKELAALMNFLQNGGDISEINFKFKLLFQIIDTTSDEIKQTFDPENYEPSEAEQMAAKIQNNEIDQILEGKIKWLDRKFAKNLLAQLIPLVKEKGLEELTDIRPANIGISNHDESTPIIYDL